MKILFVSKTKLGTPDLATVNYLPITLSRLGYSTAIICQSGGDANRLIQAGVQVVEVTRDESWFASLRKVAHSFQPEIVHVMIHLGCGIYPLIMNTASKPKFILDIRSPLLRRGLLRYLIQIKNRFEIIQYDTVASHGIESAWTVVSKWQVNAWKNIHWLPPGIELNSLTSKQVNGSKKSSLRMIYIGSLRKSRQIPKMISAVLMASQEFNLSLDIYGYGEDVTTIEAMLQEHQGKHNIRLMGLIPRHELFTRLTDYDIGLSYVPMKLYGTAPPLKTLEYLASGLAVVATKTPGHELLIQDHENGLLVDESPKSFADGILQIAHNHSLRKKLVNNGRISVEKFDWDRIVKDRLIPIYEQLMGKVS